MPTLGYWNIKGLAEPIRLLLSYVGEEYDEKSYEFGDAPDFASQEWQNDKFSLGMDFPNLPYYFDGDTKLTQSKAILRYLARKYKLDGTTEIETQKLDVLDEELMDCKTTVGKLCYDTKDNFRERLPEFLKNLRTKLAQISKFMGQNDFLIGDRLTFPDFVLFELLGLHLALDPTCLDDTPTLKAYRDRIEAKPNIKKHVTSDGYKKRAFNAPMAAYN